MQFSSSKISMLIAILTAELTATGTKMTSSFLIDQSLHVTLYTNENIPKCYVILMYFWLSQK